MLFVSKALIVIAFGLEELIEVRLAVDVPTQRRVRPEAEFAVAIGTAEAADVKHLLVGKEPFHGVHGLLTPNTGFLHWQLEFLQGEEKVC